MKDEIEPPAPGMAPMITPMTVELAMTFHALYGVFLTRGYYLGDLSSVYPIARAFRDARVQTIYGGTTEIMKEIVGRSLGL